MEEMIAIEDKKAALTAAPFVTAGALAKVPGPAQHELLRAATAAAQRLGVEHPPPTTAGDGPMPGPLLQFVTGLLATATKLGIQGAPDPGAIVTPEGAAAAARFIDTLGA